MRLLKPGSRLLSGLSLAIDVSQQSLKRRLRANGLQSLPRHRLQHHPWVVGQVPEFRVESFPELIGRVVKRPSKV